MQETKCSSLSIGTLLFALLDLVTKQLSTDNAQALASSSLAVIMHLKIFQVHSDDPDNVNDNIGSVVVLSHIVQAYLQNIVYMFMINGAHMSVIPLIAPLCTRWSFGDGKI